MSRKKISTTIYVTPEQSDRLKLLHERTKVPVAVYIREGIDLVLRHYGHLLPGQLPLDGGGASRAERERATENLYGRSAAPSTAASDGDAGDSDEVERGPANAGNAGSTSHGGHSAHAASKK
jgi:hypothetical protein